MTDLEKMFESFKQELQDYEDLRKIEFLLKHEHDFKDTVEKDYKVYLKDNEDEDPKELLWYDEWIEEYEDEMCDELTEKVNEFFTEYWIETYESKYNYIWDIMTWWGWPNLYIRLESKFEKALWKWYWWTEIIEEDISQYYNTLIDIYNLDIM